MFGLDNIVSNFIVAAPQLSALFPLLVMIILVVVNAAVSGWIAYKQKQFDWDKMLHFIQPLVFYVGFLFLLEITIIACEPYKANKIYYYIQAVFSGGQIGIWALICVKYFQQIWKKAKSLGVPTNDSIDKIVDNLDEKVEAIIPAATEEQAASSPAATIPASEEEATGETVEELK